MRKLFLLIPVLAFALLANAATTTIGPDDPTATVNNTLISALSSASDDDVIILKSGFYNESSDYLVFNKNVEVRAADGATPVIKLTTYIKVQGGKHPIISGLIFDGSVQQDSREQYFKFTDANDNELKLNNCTFNNIKKNIFRCEAGKKFVSLEVNNCKFVNSLSNVMSLESSTCGAARFDGCEFSGTANIVINGKEGSHLQECVVNNCYFHNNTKQSIYFEQSTTEGLETCDQLTVTNSTFANTTALTNWISVIEARPYSTAASTTSNAIKVVIDHCTFYNNPCVDSGHANIRTNYLSDVTVSNCVFMHPTALAQRAVYCCSGGTVSNCFTYNFTKDTERAGIAYGCNVINCVAAEPQFTDADNADYSFLNNNWETPSLSPACGAATDGLDLGDPRWHTTVATLPSVDFASAYDLVGAKAQLTGEIEVNSGNHIAYKGVSTPGIATWRIHTTKACAVQATIDMETGSESGSILQLVVFDNKGKEVGKITAPYKEDDADILMPGTIYFPAAGDYTIRLNNNQTWSSAKVEKISLAYAGGAVQNLPCTTAINEAWYGNGGTRADGKITYSSWNSENSFVKWNAATTANIFCNVTLHVNVGTAHHFFVNIYEQGQDEPFATLKENYTAYNDVQSLDIDLGKIYIASGKNLLIKVTNPVGGAVADVKSLEFTEVAIPTIAMPGTLLPADAMLSEKARIVNDSLLFADYGQEGYNEDQWAKWKISVSERAYYKFTLNARNQYEGNGHRYTISVLSNDESQVIAAKTSDWTSAAEATAVVCAELTPGDYIIKAQNPLWGSKGRLMNIVGTREGGAFTTLPGQLLGNEAMLHATKMNRDANNDIVYGDNDQPRDEYVAWNIHANEAVDLVVTLNLDADNGSGHNYVVELCQNGVKVDSVEEASGTNYNQGNIEITAKNLNIPAAGDYQIRLINRMKNSANILHGITFVEYVAPEPVIIDETATTIEAWETYVNGNPIDLSIKRTLKGGVYNTICLPFVIGSTNSMNAAFGTGYELLRLKEATLENGVLNLIFEPKTTMESGVPYLIKPVNDVIDPSFTGRTIDKTTASTETKGDVQFVGTFVKQTIDQDEHNLYLGNDNSLYFVNNNVTIKGMRGYFHLNIQNPQQVVRRANIIAGGQVITSVELIKDTNNGVLKTIENGQIVIIRDGVRYNVMGVKLQ